jgi:HK97 family phage major capsid protein
MSLHEARELRAERAKLVEQAQADVDANPQGFDADEQQRWDKRMGDIDSLEKRYQAIEARYAAKAELAEKLAQEQEARDDRKEFGAKREDAEEIRHNISKAFRSWAQGEMSSAEFRAIQGQTKGTAAQGGNVVPTDFLAEVQTHLKAYGGVRDVARIITTANGQNLPIPTSDDTGNTAKLVSEATAPSTTTRVPFGQVTMEAARYQSGPIKVSMELLQDSAIDIESYISEAMGTRFGRITNTHYTTRSSTESAGPHGFIGESSGAVAVANNALTYENVIDLIHSVDPAYRTPDAAWMTNDAGFAELRKLRGSTAAASDRLIWQPSLVPGMPDTLLGYRVVLNQDVPLEGTTGNKWLWFGNWNRGYAIRDVMGMTMRRLDERYAEEGNIALIGYMRTDGRAILPSTTAARRPFRCILHSS